MKPHLYAAIRTRAGRSAVASIQIGSLRHDEALDVHQFIDRHFRSASGTSAAQMHEGRVYFGTWSPLDHFEARAELPSSESTIEEPHGEELVIARHGPRLFEVHCHGGKMAAARITSDVRLAGGVVMTAEELLRAQSADLLAAESEIAVAQAATDLAAAHLLAQLRGALHSRITYAQSLLDQREFEALAAVLDELLGRAKLGLHLLTPFQVVVIGPPNVGKSSLINKLLGFERSIVFDQPGTTRDVLKTTTAWDGWLFELSDTAGVREQSSDAIEQAGIDRAIDSIECADLLVVVADATVDPTTSVDVALRLPSSVPILHVTNKCDLLDNLPDNESNLPEGPLRVSAITGEGVLHLVERIVAAVTQTVAVGEPVPFLVRHRQLLETARAAVDNNHPNECHRALVSLIGKSVL
jgi:tRNA modification GTPase